MKQMTHRIFFTIVFSVGGILFLTAFLFQFQLINFIPETEKFVRWAAPIGLGLVLIGATGMYITSKRHQMKKLKEQELIEEEEESAEISHEGKRFQDYITSPEEGTTVYTLFLAGVVIIVWGIFMLFQWIRALFQ